jgi:hypothetical protein
MEIETDVLRGMVAVSERLGRAMARELTGAQFTEPSFQLSETAVPSFSAFCSVAHEEFLIDWLFEKRIACGR